MPAQKSTLEFNDQIVRQFVLATILWGVVGMLVGVLIASQLNFWQVNFQTAWLTFGRLRPLHTNAVIFAFVGNGMFMGIYYSLQRLCKARMFSDTLSWINFWGWNAIIVAAAAPRMPAALLEQLAPGGRLIAPVGTTAQQLQWMERTASGVIERALDLVHFVPLRAGKQ